MFRFREGIGAVPRANSEDKAKEIMSRS